MKKSVRAAIAIVLAASTAASAQMNKCRQPNGKIVFTDQPCAEGTQIDKPAPAPAPARAPEAPSDARYQLTEADRARIKALEAIVDARENNAEQRTAAQLEIFSIRRGAEVKLTAQDKVTREALVKALATDDKARRAEMLVKLRSFYDR